jgi:outer membrane protein assembly factor BamB
LQDDGGDAAGGGDPTDARGLAAVSGQVDEPELRWSVEAKVSGAPPLFGEDGLVFTLDWKGDGRRGDSHHLVARAGADGAEVWRADPGPEYANAHLLGDDVVVVMSTETATEIVSFDQRSGERNWQLERDGFFNALPHGGLLLGKTPDELVAYAGDTGEQAWAVPGSHAEAGSDHVYLAEGETVRAVGLDDGEEAWSASLSGPVSDIAFSGDRVVATSEDEVVALAPDGGDELWRADVRAGAEATVAVAGASTFVVSGSDDTVALARASGDVLDDKAFHLDRELWADEKRLPLYADAGLLVFLHADPPWTEVVDGATGERIGRLEIVASASRTMLYAVEDDVLTAYRTRDLAEQWSVDVPGGQFVYPGDDVIVVSTGAGYELWS